MGIKLLDTEAQLKKKIGEAIRSRINRFNKKVCANSLEDIKKLLSDRMRASETYQSITGSDGIGILRGEFGLTNATVSKFDRLLNELITVELDYKNIRVNLTDGLKSNTTFSITIKPETSLFSFVSEGDYLIPWMEWLLYGGTSAQISGYRIKTKPGIGRSRLAIMIGSNGDSYQVNAHYAGTVNDNWLTQIIIHATQEIERIILRHVEENKSSI